jgi:serine/threonine protein kinase
MEVQALCKVAGSLHPDHPLNVLLPSLVEGVLAGNTAWVAAQLVTVRQAGFDVLGLMQRGPLGQEAGMEVGRQQGAAPAPGSWDQTGHVTNGSSAAHAQPAAAAAMDQGQWLYAAPGMAAGAGQGGFNIDPGAAGWGGLAQQQQQQPQPGGLEGQEGELPDFKEAMVGLPQLAGRAPAPQLPDLQPQLDQLKARVEDGFIQACADKYNYSAGQVAAARIDYQHAWQEMDRNGRERLWQGAALEGYNGAEQQELWVLTKLADAFKGPLHAVAMARFLAAMIGRSYLGVSQHAESWSLLQRMQAAAGVEERDLLFTASGVPPPAQCSRGRVERGSLLTLTVGRPDTNRGRLVLSYPQQLLDLQLVEPLGEGGMATVWMGKPAPGDQQMEAWRLHLKLAADAEVPPLLAVKMGLSYTKQYDDFGSEIRANRAAGWRLARDATDLEVEACKEAAGMGATGPSPLTGDLLAAGWVDLQLGPADAPVTKRVQVLVMPAAPLRSLYHMVEEPPLSVGQLFDGKRVPEPLAKHIAVQLLVAAATCHAVGFMHRDIKPGNVLVTLLFGLMVFLLADFGAAAEVGGVEVNVTKKTCVGTLDYMAEEQEEGTAQTPTVDIYSIGIVILELLRGKSPFVSDQEEGKGQAGKQQPSSSSSEGSDAPVVNRRQVLADKLMWDAPDMGLRGIRGPVRKFCSQLCEVLPHHRPSAFDALQLPYLRDF